MLPRSRLIRATPFPLYFNSQTIATALLGGVVEDWRPLWALATMKEQHGTSASIAQPDDGVELVNFLNVIEASVRLTWGRRAPRQTKQMLKESELVPKLKEAELVEALATSGVR